MYIEIDIEFFWTVVIQKARMLAREHNFSMSEVLSLFLSNFADGDTFADLEEVYPDTDFIRAFRQLVKYFKSLYDFGDLLDNPPFGFYFNPEYYERFNIAPEAVINLMDLYFVQVFDERRNIYVPNPYIWYAFVYTCLFFDEVVKTFAYESYDVYRYSKKLATKIYHN